jgi:hypothetical protein
MVTAMRAIALPATILVVAAALVQAHSWLDCTNWKFNDATAYTNPSRQRWSDADGRCEGWPRRFEVGFVPFGKYDSVQFFRHWVQPRGGPACRSNRGDFNAEGSNEGVATPRSAAYGPNKNVYSRTWGTMARVQAGATMCWRWPAKNHMRDVNTATNPVFVGFDPVSNRATDLTQAQYDANRIATLLFANCPVAGPPSTGDSFGTGSDLRPCGGCFTVPTAAPGVYSMQWRWPMRANDAETYTSCADVEIIAGSGSTTTTPTTTTPTTGTTTPTTTTPTTTTPTTTTPTTGGGGTSTTNGGTTTTDPTDPTTTTDGSGRRWRRRWRFVSGFNATEDGFVNGTVDEGHGEWEYYLAEDESSSSGTDSTTVVASSSGAVDGGSSAPVLDATTKASAASPAARVMHVAVAAVLAALALLAGGMV